MGIQSGVDFIFHIARSPGSVNTRGINEPHRELVEIVQRARKDFAGSLRHRNFGFYMFGIQHPLFEFEALIAGSDIGEISGRRMAGCAPSRSVEILLTCLGVAGLEIGNVYALASTGFCVSGIILLGMDKGRQTGNLLIGKIEAGLPLVRTSVSYDGADLVSACIFSHQSGTCEIRSTLATARIAAMAKGAISPEQITPA